MANGHYDLLVCFRTQKVLYRVATAEHAHCDDRDDRLGVGSGDHLLQQLSTAPPRQLSSL